MLVQKENNHDWLHAGLGWATSICKPDDWLSAQKFPQMLWTEKNKRQESKI